MSDTRYVSWFSCGAASAVATKMALSMEPGLEICYCEVKEEHPDNMRFLRECEEWFGKRVNILGRDKYKRSIYNLFELRKYIAGVRGAICTTELKKKVREEYQKHNDCVVFGYTAEEEDRMNRFIDSNNDVELWVPLIDNNVTKQDCISLIAKAGIELPEMYKLGYKNNNCIGCVKGGMGYWNKIRVDFPDTFKRMAELQDRIGAKPFQVTRDGKRVRASLSEILPTEGHPVKDMPLACGIVCEWADKVINTGES